MSNNFNNNNSMDANQQLATDGSNKRREHPLAHYQFSADELRVLRECNRDSFWQRSLPLGTTFGLGSYLAVKNGYLKGNAKYGAVPKIVLGVICGYFMGKFSYQKKCAEKLMQLPDSKLAEMLRMKKKGGFIESLTPDQGFGAGLSLSPFSSNTEQYSDHGFSKSTSLNLDTERPSQSGLDDTYRPNIDSPATVFEDIDLPLEPPKNQTSYDELRQKNRADFASKQKSPFYRPIQQDVPPVIRGHENPVIEESPATPPGNATRKPKNKYGDEWTS